MFIRKAILIVHGFAGGTYDQEELAHELEYFHNYDVFQFTLPGHDKLITKATSKEWLKSGEKQIEKLIHKGYKNIYVIGHSMGGVIATYLAGKYPEIKKLVLAAPAFKYLVFKDDKLQIAESLKITNKIFKDYSYQEVLSRMVRMPIATINEFMKLVKDHQKDPTKVTIPTLLIQGNNDAIVPLASSEYVYNNLSSKYKKLLIVDDLTHDVFNGKRKEQAINEIIKFLKTNPYLLKQKGEIINL